jgi:hypothetical protein
MNFVRGKKFSLIWTILIPASWVARFWVGTLDFFYRHGLRKILEPSIPVISVGNLTYGGTNKTPFVEMLCKLMQVGGVSPGVVSRGYGGDNPDVRVVEAGKISGLAADRRYVGDEPFSVVTGIYNEIMRAKLPLAGIECIVVPRKEHDGAPISASSVRKLLHDGRVEDTKALVPETTYRYFLTPNGRDVIGKIQNAKDVVHY